MKLYGGYIVFVGPIGGCCDTSGVWCWCVSSVALIVSRCCCV